MKLSIINKSITSLGKSKAVYTAKSAQLSRDILTATLEHWDAQILNKFIDNIVDADKPKAIQFFRHFTPFMVADGIFHAIEGDRKKAKANAAEKIQLLLDGTDDFRSWAKSVKTTEPKTTDTAVSVINGCKKALKLGASPEQIIDALLLAGLDIAELKVALAAKAI
jgi:hypothetical protein